MKNKHNILVHIANTEGDHHQAVALTKAIEYASLYKATLHCILFDKIERTEKKQHPKYAVMNEPDPIHRKAKDKKQEEAIDMLAEVIAGKLPAEFVGKLIGATGKPEEVIEKVIEETAADLIISEQDELTTLEELFSQTTTQKVIQAASVPVLVVSSETNLNLQKVIVATDLGDAIPEHIFEVLRKFQERAIEIHMAYVANTDMITESEGLRKMEALGKYTYLEHYEKHLIYGAASKSKGLVDLADSLGADLILMKTYSKSGFWRLFSDELTKKIIDSGEVAVLTEKVEPF